MHTHTTSTWAHGGGSTHDGSGGADSGSDSGGRRLGSSSMRPRVVPGDGFTSATTATWHGWRRPVRPRFDHGGGTWSAPDHGVGSPVDRRQLTTRCRSGHAHQCSGQQLTQSSRLNRRPFTFTTDV